MILTLLVAGCVSVGSGSALCDATASDVDALAGALVADGGDRSVVAGQRLIAKLDAGCGR
jgi:outer membrane murein-binding lipoprotein Lpp